MKVILEVNDRFAIVPEKYFRRLSLKILETAGQWNRVIVSLAVVDNQEMRGLNKRCRFLDRTTDVLAFSFMPNHLHLLLRQLVDNGISKFMQKLTTAYVMYYNKKYKHTGGLFEGKFKSEHVSEERYLKYLFSYIHLNPIKLIQKDWKEVGVKNKKETLEYLYNYQYSSYLDYLGIERIQNNILNKETFPKYFPNKKSFTKEIFEWLNYNK